ncbi:MAG TPA: gliding motility protein GldL [Bacteroides sp.]|nr:gliding motility protein GldL [Bacteroides sp.]
MNFTELTQSAGWKNFMAKLYGLGASVVILGALFKIQHFPGGGPMITVGLGVEAVIFFFSAFEPLHEELDWTLVYPELAGMTDPDELDEYRDEALAGRGVTLEKFEDLFNQAEIKPETIKNLGNGLNNLSETAGNLADISEASVATRQYAENVQKAAESVGGLTDNYSESTNKLASAANTLSDSYQQAAEKIASSGGAVAASYSAAAEKAKSITSSNEAFGSQLESMNQKLQALNDAYASQLQGTNEHMKGSDQVYKGIEDMMKNLKASVEETEKYKEQMSQLSKNLADLNVVYGNMLTAMNAK